MNLRMDIKLLQKGILTHVFFISLFLIVPTLAFVRPPGESFFALSRVFVQDTAANFGLLCFFYLNYYVLLPKLYFGKKYLLYVVSGLAFLAIAMMIPRLVGQYVQDQYQTPPAFTYGPHYPHEPFKNDHSILNFIFMEFRRHLYLFFTAIFFSFLLKSQEHVARLRQEKLEAQLSSLKAQINPHFLFNTLNSIYALSVMKDDKAAEAITNLSGLMRYVIKDANDYKIPLQKEIEYLENYIGLQKARLGKTTQVSFECSGTAGNKLITPLILITYIENAFKYGVNPDLDDCHIQITLQLTETGLRLYTFNKKAGTANINSTGIGMRNTGERLQHLYPEKHTLQVAENNETYALTLILELV